MNRTMKPIDPARLLADAEPHLADCEILAARNPDTAADWVAVRDLARAAPDLARRCVELEAERDALAANVGRLRGVLADLLTATQEPEPGTAVSWDWQQMTKKLRREAESLLAATPAQEEGP